MFQKPQRRQNKEALQNTRKQRCVVCGRPGEAHHVITRGAGGPDEPWNLMGLDRWHHVEIHQIGNTKMAEKYRQVELWFLSHGWEYDENRMKWIHRLGGF